MLLGWELVIIIDDQSWLMVVMLVFLPSLCMYFFFVTKSPCKKSFSARMVQDSFEHGFFFRHVSPHGRWWKGRRPNREVRKSTDPLAQSVSRSDADPSSRQRQGGRGSSGGTPSQRCMRCRRKIVAFFIRETDAKILRESWWNDQFLGV